MQGRLIRRSRPRTRKTRSSAARNQLRSGISVLLWFPAKGLKNPIYRLGNKKFVERPAQAETLKATGAGVPVV